MMSQTKHRPATWLLAPGFWALRALSCAPSSGLSSMGEGRDPDRTRDPVWNFFTDYLWMLLAPRAMLTTFWRLCGPGRTPVQTLGDTLHIATRCRDATLHLQVDDDGRGPPRRGLTEGIGLGTTRAGLRFSFQAHAS